MGFKEKDLDFLKKSRSVCEGWFVENNLGWFVRVGEIVGFRRKIFGFSKKKIWIC